MKATSHTYQVTYTKANRQIGSITVKAQDENQALTNARYLCATGRDFKAAMLTQEVYVKPRLQGFAGR